MEKLNRPEFVTNPHLQYLNHWQKEGADMRAARKLLLDTFPDLTPFLANQVLDYWRQTRPKPQTNGKPGPRTGGIRAITAQNQKEVSPALNIYVGDTPTEQEVFEQFRELSSRGRLARLVEGERAIEAVRAVVKDAQARPGAYLYSDIQSLRNVAIVSHPDKGGDNVRGK